MARFVALRWRHEPHALPRRELQEHVRTSHLLGLALQRRLDEDERLTQQQRVSIADLLDRSLELGDANPALECLRDVERRIRATLDEAITKWRKHHDEIVREVEAMGFRVTSEGRLEHVDDAQRVLVESFPPPDDAVHATLPGHDTPIRERLTSRTVALLTLRGREFVGLRVEQVKTLSSEWWQAHRDRDCAGSRPPARVLEALDAIWQR